MTSDPTEVKNGERVCPRCGAPFICDVDAGSDHCWCFDLPHVMPLETAAYEGCLCPECLNRLIEAWQQNQS